MKQLITNKLYRKIFSGGLFLLLVGSILWTSFSFYRDSSQNARQLEARLITYEKAIRFEPEIRQRIEEIQNPVANIVSLLAGENEALAGAQLQQHLKTIALNAGGMIESTQSLKTIDEGSLQKITVRAQMTVSNRALQEILYALEAGKPYVYVENLNINIQTQSSDVAQDLLKITIDLYGYYKEAEKI